MSVTFNLDLQRRLCSGKPIELELGAAGIKNGLISIDHLNLLGVDIVANLENGLPFCPDNSVDAIFSKSLLDLIDNLGLLMQEIWRSLKPNRKKNLFVPDFSNAEYGFTPQIPQFYNEYKFIIENNNLVFKSLWKYRYRFRNYFGKLIKSSTWWQDFMKNIFATSSRVIELKSH